MTASEGMTGTGSKRASGFTLVELMVVIAIAGLVIQMVVMNMGALIPRSKLDSQCNQFMADLDFLRSEARLQGKRYRMELDLTRHVWRVVLPAEERITTEQTLEETMPQALGWTAMEEGVQSKGIVQAGGSIVQRRGIAYIEFDENGFSADWNVFFNLARDEDMVWTVQLLGLTGQSQLRTSFDGVEHKVDPIGEFGF